MRRAPSLRRLRLEHHARWLLWFRDGPPTNLAVSPGALAKIRAGMLRDPRPLARPVVVIAGYADPGIYSALVARELRRLTSRSRADFLLPTINPFVDIAASGARAARQVRAALADRGLDPGTPVDMVGMSMGGLVCRTAASALVEDPLEIARLFTLGTPHRGAEIAAAISPSTASSQMRPGSAFLGRLDACPVPDETYCFTAAGDTVIGADRGVAPGATAYRLPGRPGEDHLSIMADPIALVEIARRLRGEPGVLVPDEHGESH